MSIMRFVVGVSMAILFVMNCAAEEKKDADQLQGFWAAATYVQDGEGEGQKVDPKDSAVRWIFAGDKVVFLADVEGGSPKGTFKLDPTKKPKTIDIVFPPLAGTAKGQTIPGIYELDGDKLRICYHPEGGARPTEFKSKAGSKLILIGFERLKKL